MRVYSKGDRVTQPQYGPGTVVDANDRHTTIDFDQHGPRTFVTTMVTLESTSEPAPVKAKKGGGRRAKEPKAAAAGPRQA